MKKGKSTKNIERNKGYFFKIAVMFLIGALILTVASCGKAESTGEAEYPPPQNLYISGFTGSGADRVVNLFWEVPEVGPTVNQYVVYKNGAETARTSDTEHQDIIGNSDCDFYVTAIYESGTESGQSNTVTTENTADISPVSPGTGKDSKGSQNGEDSTPEGGGGQDTGVIIENDEDPEIAGENSEDDADSKSFNLNEMLSGPCGNPYFPVAEGISHTYSSSGGIVISTITSVHEDGFTVTHTADGGTQIHEWKCLPEGLVDFSNPVGEALKVMGGEATIIGNTSVTGVTIPASISIGDNWSQTYSGTLDVQEYDGALDFSLTTNHSVVGTEEVAVPFGTFKALKLNNSLESNFILKTHGISTPLYTYTATSTSWIVENIGTVKTTTQGSIKGVGQMAKMISHKFSDTTELIEFSLP